MKPEVLILEPNLAEAGPLLAHKFNQAGGWSSNTLWLGHMMQAPSADVNIAVIGPKIRFAKLARHFDSQEFYIYSRLAGSKLQIHAFCFNPDIITDQVPSPNFFLVYKDRKEPREDATMIIYDEIIGGWLHQSTAGLL